MLISIKTAKIQELETIVIKNKSYLKALTRSKTFDSFETDFNHSC